jgi:RNA polymerase sigma factor (sigma-70 family)
MATADLNKIIGQLHSILEKHDIDGLSDGDLLKRYLQQRDETAFEALVARHGPMVLGVCRRVLRNPHDVEDAFQAAFLVLLQKASSLRSPGTVGNWLYGVAFRTAQEARRAVLKRCEKEAKVLPKPEARADDCKDLREALDEELERLPEKYRTVIVLTDLEGATGKEVAVRIGVPEGTVASRLARGRALLAKRLTRHGFAVTGCALAMVLSQKALLAGVPPSLVASTIKAASVFSEGNAAAGLISAKVAALTEGVMKTMLLTKLKIVTAALLATAVTGSGAGWLIYQSQAAGLPKTRQETEARAQQSEPPGAAAAAQDKAKETQPRTEDASKPQQKEAPAKKDLEKLQGTWIAAVGGEFRGKTATEQENIRAGHRLVISGDKFAWFTALQVEPLMKGTVRIDETKRPKTMDMEFERESNRAVGKCIYELDGDTLKICYGEPDRPTEFKTNPDSDNKLYVWKLEKK